MNCREFIEFIWRYLGDDLSQSQRATFDAHLAECPQCVHYLATYHKTVELSQRSFDPTDDVLPAQVPEELVRAILAARSK